MRLEKLDNVPVALYVDVPPQELDVSDPPPGLLQSTPECWMLPYEDVELGETMLFILIVGCVCWLDSPGDMVPIPGLIAPKAGNDEFRAPRLLSGVTDRLWCAGTERLFEGGGETGGVDHENVAAGEALFPDLLRFAAGRDGSTAEDDADDAFPQVSPPSISWPPEVP